jgi:regulator of sigma E protease
MSYLIVVLSIGFVILVHEFGHFVAAKRAGIAVAVFSLGFGPKLIARKWRGTEYRLSLIPLGGYVLPEIEDEKEFFAIPVNKRMAMALGGPLASMLFPAICFSIIFPIRYGFSLANVVIKPILRAMNLLLAMAAALPRIFSHGEQLSGIVGVVAQGGAFVGNSPLNAVQFAALISLNLALLNLLPIPALDGGKIFLYLLEKIHPKLRRLHMPLAVAGWIFLIGLMVYVTVADVGKLFAVHVSCA